MQHNRQVQDVKVCGAVAGDMHLVPKKDHCNTGCNSDTRTTNILPHIQARNAKKENDSGIFSRVVETAEAKVGMLEQQANRKLLRTRPQGSQARLAQ